MARSLQTRYSLLPGPSATSYHNEASAKIPFLAKVPIFFSAKYFSLEEEVTDKEAEKNVLSNTETIRHLTELALMMRIMIATINLQPKENIIGPEVDVPFVETGVYKSIMKKLEQMESVLDLRPW